MTDTARIKKIYGPNYKRMCRVLSDVVSTGLREGIEVREVYVSKPKWRQALGAEKSLCAAAYVVFVEDGKPFVVDASTHSANIDWNKDTIVYSLIASIDRYFKENSSFYDVDKAFGF